MKLKTISRITSVGAILFLAWSGPSASAADPPKTRVAEENQYIQPQHVTDTDQSSAHGMRGGKCRTIWRPIANKLTSDFFVWRGAEFGQWASLNSLHQPLWKPVHYCPGCSSTITTTGTGTSSRESVHHSCTVIDRSCCAPA